MKELLPDLREKWQARSQLGHANFVWVRRLVHHLAPAGVADYFLANDSMSSSQSGEGEIRKNLIEADLVALQVSRQPRVLYFDLPEQVAQPRHAPSLLSESVSDSRGYTAIASRIPATSARADGGVVGGTGCCAMTLVSPYPGSSCPSSSRYETNSSICPWSARQRPSSS